LNRTVLAILVAAVIFATVWVFRGGKESAEMPPMNSSSSVAPQSRRPPAPDVVLAIKPGSRSPAKAADSPKLSPLMKELTTSPVRPLYDRLSQKTSRTPEESYVLARILVACTEVAGQLRDPLKKNAEEERKNFASAVSEKDPNRAQRIAAFEKITERTCAGFEGMKTDPQRVKDLMSEAAAGGDPKARARAIAEQLRPGGVVNGNNMPTLTDQQLDTLRDVARSGDPYAMMIVGSLLSSTWGDLLIRAGPDERPIDQRAFYDAWALAACNAGYDCGPSNNTLLNGCAQNGNCGAQNLEEYLYFYGNSPQQSQLINQYRSHLISAMQSGDWSYFAFVRARPPGGSVFVFGAPGP